jgi:uncharacterized protein YndB with AHSA1/START domain/DNA-binding transcriptional ArsR family regulator
VDSLVFAALSEPNRLRIIELLDSAPRSVGEIAAQLGLRQPQTTKHLQTLERAGLVTMHPLGQRRIYSLQRETFRELTESLQTLTAAHPSEPVLARYAEAIEAERALARHDPNWASGRTFRFTRHLKAPAATVWAHWTTPDLIRRWWSPEHFEVIACEVEPVAGGRLEIVMQEGDGTRHHANGRFLELAPPKRLRYQLGPRAAGGTPLLTTVHDLTLHDEGHTTKLSLTIRVIAATPTSVPALAGIQPGWEQALDKLAHTLDAGESSAS